jgi:hypothetical protein
VASWLTGYETAFKDQYDYPYWWIPIVAPIIGGLIGSTIGGGTGRVIGEAVGIGGGGFLGNRLACR